MPYTDTLRRSLSLKRVSPDVFLSSSTCKLRRRVARGNRSTNCIHAVRSGVTAVELGLDAIRTLYTRSSVDEPSRIIRHATHVILRLVCRSGRSWHVGVGGGSHLAVFLPVFVLSSMHSSWCTLPLTEVYMQTSKCVYPSDTEGGTCTRLYWFRIARLRPRGW